MKMKQTVMAGDIPFLPGEIMGRILIRLPVKSLFRFQCVCKHWKNLIKTPFFISEHFHHPARQNSCLLFKRKGLWLLDCKIRLHKLDIAPLIGSSNSFEIVDSSNGLLCIDVDRYSRFSSPLLLWNPSTREIRKVPPYTKEVRNLALNRRKVALPLHSGIAFGFSPIVNDYKIVVPHVSFRSNEVVLVVVYSLSSGSWKEVEFGMEEVVFGSKNVTVNGAMCWFGREQRPDSVYNVIISFDIANEAFSLIRTSNWPASASRLTVHENKLAVVSFSESLVELWVMEDSAGADWSKKYSSHLFPFVAGTATIWKNQIVSDFDVAGDEHHQEWKREQDITLLNISTNELTWIDVSKCGFGYGCGRVFEYAESLVPLGCNGFCVMLIKTVDWRMMKQHWFHFWPISDLTVLIIIPFEQVI